MNPLKTLRQKIAIILTLLTLTSFVFARTSRAVVFGTPRLEGASNFYDVTKAIQQIEVENRDTAAEDLNIKTFGDNLVTMNVEDWAKIFTQSSWTALTNCVQTMGCTGVGCNIPCGELVAYGGVVPIARTMIAGVFHRPNIVTLAEYKNSVLANSFLGKTAYAQTGEGLLAPILIVWQMTRNIAYAGFVLVLIVVGFMIMFRYKLGPQTSITLMNALPKVAISLILVTFSYPIVALFLDITWGAIGALANAAIHPSKIGLNLDVSTIFADMYTGGFWNIVAMNLLTLFGIMFGVVAIVAFFLALFMGIVNFIVRFTKILLMTAFGPLILAWGAIPGTDTTTGWFKGIAANCLSLIGILVFILLGIYFWVQVPASFITAFGAAPGIPFMAAMTGIVLGTITLLMSWSIPGTIDKALAGKGVPGWYTRGGGGGGKR